MRKRLILCERNNVLANDITVRTEVDASEVDLCNEGLRRGGASLLLKDFDKCSLRTLICKLFMLL